MVTVNNETTTTKPNYRRFGKFVVNNEHVHNIDLIFSFPTLSLRLYDQINFIYF